MSRHNQKPYEPDASDSQNTHDLLKQANGNPVDDQQIINRVLQGDLAAFELLMRRYNQRLFRVTRGIVTNAATAEEVVQEAYLSAFANLHTFEGRSSFATWLTRIAIHAAMARIKREKPMFDYQGQEPAFDHRVTHHTNTSPDELVSNRELGNVLTDAIDALPVELRSVFVCRVVEQIDTRTTATCLDLSEANVNVRLHRARAQLRKTIDQILGVEARQLFQFDGKRCDRMVQNVLHKIRSGHHA